VDFLLANWMLILVALTSGTMLLLPLLQGGGAGLTPAAAVQLINREKAVVIDVCEPAEFAAGHVGGSRNLPLGSLDGAKGLPSNKSQPLVVVCARGARAGRAASQLTKAGHQRVHVLSGGLAAWREAGLPVEKSA